MKNKILALLLLIIPSISYAGLPDDKIDSPEEVNQLNNDLKRLNTGKLDIRPGNVIPKTDSVYDLGAIGTEWNNLYVDTITARGLSVSTVTASSGTFTAISVGTITYNGIAARQNTVGSNNIIEAWVVFNGTGTILSSYNVSSLTDNGPGDFTINFTRDFEDANYCASGNSSEGSAGGPAFVYLLQNTVSSLRVRISDHTGVLRDPDTRANVMIVR